VWQGNFESQRRNFTPLIKQRFHLYFGWKVRNQDKSWVYHMYYVRCVWRLNNWANGSRYVPFAVPMVWREINYDSTDCHFCQTNITRIGAEVEQVLLIFFGKF
jgi:hypothetical protein